jgi:hypothetical protein
MQPPPSVAEACDLGAVDRDVVAERPRARRADALQHALAGGALPADHAIVGGVHDHQVRARLAAKRVAQRRELRQHAPVAPFDRTGDAPRVAHDVEVAGQRARVDARRLHVPLEGAEIAPGVEREQRVGFAGGHPDRGLRSQREHVAAERRVELAQQRRAPQLLIRRRLHVRRIEDPPRGVVHVAQAGSHGYEQFGEREQQLAAHASIRTRGSREHERQLAFRRTLVERDSGRRRGRIGVLEQPPRQREALAALVVAAGDDDEPGGPVIGLASRAQRLERAVPVRAREDVQPW